MIGCLQTCVRKHPIIALYFESEKELKFYNLAASLLISICYSFIGTLPQNEVLLPRLPVTLKLFLGPNTQAPSQFKDKLNFPKIMIKISQCLAVM